MSNPHIFRAKRTPTSRSGRRRPTGVSRRQHKKQLGFETLEDRRVMSADSSLLVIPLDLSSLSSVTAEGAEQILLRELQRYADQIRTSQNQVATNAIPTDPLTAEQWFLINTGQEVGNEDFQNIFATPGEDINVAPAWQLGVTGEGVVVAVIDTGVEILHPDLAANIDPALQLDPLDGDNDANPNLNDPSLAHGTAVAGIIGAVANNGLGGTGIAPGVQLVPIRLIDAGQTEQAFIDAFRFATDQIDITNNSWGPGVVRGLDGPTPNETLALRDSIFFGRPDENGNPLGVIHVFAAGNSGLESDTAGYNGWVNSRYTIGVTGVDHDGQYNNIDGTVTSYPETSASVLVAAPTGSNTLNIVEDGAPSAIGSGIITTDITGEFGYNILPDPNTGQEFDRDFLEDTDYTSAFNGTSAAAPMVSGVIALMLEANPNLTWRDVQEILVRSSRQNAQFATQANGIDKALGIEYQSTWITNQVPLFSDPDLYDPLIDNVLQILNPTLDPELTLGPSAISYAPTPQVLTNGAGYTVSQGRGTNRENIGYAQGVVDAELAVLLAQQWTTKGQNLPDELTFTTAVNGSPNLPAAERVVDLFGPGTDDLIVPGGLFGASGFSAYWQEYLAPVPDFGQTFPGRGLPIELTVPSPNDMTLETIELTVTIDGDMTEFLDNVRIVLVSPTGTQSELNFYFVDPSFAGDAIHQVEGSPLLNLNGLDGVSSLAIDAFDAGSVDTGISTFTFSSNRIWGERSDDAIIFDPSTGEPAGNTFGNFFNAIDPSAGSFSTQGWQLYMENYSPVDFALSSFEIAWHGSPIEANTERVQGLIGIDDNQNDAFNFSRVIQTINQIDNDPALRLGEIQNLIDPTTETFASNVTVFASRDVNANGILDAADVLVDQFVTGADGNYYFDLVPDNYIISLDQESLVGLTALDDFQNSSGRLQNFQAEWAISTSFFQVWDYDANLEVLVDGSDAPLPFLDALGSAVTYGMKNINFLLDPGAPPAQQVVFSGSIFADINGDGIFNRDDVAVPGIGVFGDENRNGELDAGEVLVTTDANGQYTLTILTSDTNVINVGVRPPADWTASNPDVGFQAFFSEPGDVFTGIDFYVQPPSVTSTGDGSALSGIILGTVFDDRNGDKLRQADEFGVPNQTVYIDLNNSGAIDAGDAVTQTNSNGAYAFANVADGDYFLRFEPEVDSGVSQTFPDINLPQFARIEFGGTALTVDFGISSGGVGGGEGDFDFGDLPDVYRTKLEDDGPRHPESPVFLGSMIDSEPDGLPSDDALGDDDNFLRDEDGVVLVDGVLVPGSTATLTVTASAFGGNLQAWIDYNNDGDFDDIIDGVSEQVIINRALIQGENTVTFEVPASVVVPTVYARFRLGEWGLGSTGLAQFGEVEDYVLTIVPGSIPQILINGPDFDQDGDVDGSDFLAWQRGFGTSNALPTDGDADSDNNVDGDDLVIWAQDFGQGSSVPQVLATGDFDSDGDTDGSDFLAFQRGYGLTASLSTGDGNQDGNVNGADLQVWENSYSDAPAAVAVALSVYQPPLGSQQTVASSSVTSSSAGGQQMTQPGFREDLVAGVVDTADSSDRQNLAFIASEVERRSQQHSLRLPSVARVARSEYRGDKAHQAHVEARAELGLALRDRVLDQAFAKRHQALEEIVSDRFGEFNAEEALAVAFDEEIDWRLG